MKDIDDLGEIFMLRVNEYVISRLQAEYDRGYKNGIANYKAYLEEQDNE